MIEFSRLPEMTLAELGAFLLDKKRRDEAEAEQNKQREQEAAEAAARG